MNNEAISFGIVTGDQLITSHPLYSKISQSAEGAARIFAHHLDGEARDSTINSVTKQSGYRQIILAKAVEHELDIYAQNQNSSSPSTVGDMALRIASDAAFQMDNLRIHNALTLPEQKFELGERGETLVAALKYDPSNPNESTIKELRKEIREQSRGNYSALSESTQMDIADDIYSMRHMSAATQNFGIGIAEDLDRAAEAGPQVQAQMPARPAPQMIDQAVGM